ncbi:MAG: hypothetical protein ACYC28_01695 [Longimicrobiales bacterium]
MSTLDEAGLRTILQGAADHGYRIAMAAVLTHASDVDPEREIALAQRYYTLQALRLVPGESVEQAEPPLHWSIQELLELMAYGYSPALRARGGPPITWAPWEEWKRWRTDGVVDARLALLRKELADVGVVVATTSTEEANREPGR